MSDKIVRAQLALLAKASGDPHKDPAAQPAQPQKDKRRKRHRAQASADGAPDADAVRQRNMAFYTATAPPKQ